jgi:hypothetical protein
LQLEIRPSATIRLGHYPRLFRAVITA